MIMEWEGWCLCTRLLEGQQFLFELIRCFESGLVRAMFSFSLLIQPPAHFFLSKKFKPLAEGSTSGRQKVVDTL